MNDVELDNLHNISVVLAHAHERVERLIQLRIEQEIKKTEAYKAVKKEKGVTAADVLVGKKYAKLYQQKHRRNINNYLQKEKELADIAIDLTTGELAKHNDPFYADLLLNNDANNIVRLILHYTDISDKDTKQVEEFFRLRNRGKSHWSTKTWDWFTTKDYKYE